MNNESITVMKEGTWISDEKDEVFDLGAYKSLYVHVRIKVPSNASQYVVLQHAAINEDGAFENLGSNLSLATAGNETEDVAEFMRYVRFVASSSISTQPTVSIYIVAKEN